MARLDQRGLPRFFGGGHTGGAGKKAPDVDRVGGVISPLVNDLEHITQSNDAGRDLHAAGAPAVGKRHLTRAKGHLVARHGHGLEQGAPDALFGALIQKRKVIVGVHHAAS